MNKLTPPKDLLSGMTTTAAPAEMTSAVADPPGLSDNYPHDWPHSRDIQGQHEVRILSVSDGGVELRQATQHSGTDDQESPVIDVTSSNVVRLALGILDAAGFKNISVETHSDDGIEELKPGSCAADFTWSPPAPPVPQLPAPKPAEVKPPPEPEYSPWADDEAVILEQQKCTAVYRNPSGGLVVRQLDDDDSTIIIVAENIPAFIKRVTEVGREAN